MIKVVDNFLSKYELKLLYESLKSPQTDWYIGKDKSNSNLKNNSFVKAIDPYTAQQYKILDDILLKIKKENILHTNILHQVYFNCVKPGDKFDYHVDADGTSILIYCNPVWKLWWGSGTQFKNPQKIVRPKPGRMILFNGQTEHRCVAPNLLMNDFGRLSVVFQFKK